MHVQMIFHQFLENYYGSRQRPAAAGWRPNSREPRRLAGFWFPDLSEVKLSRTTDGSFAMAPQIALVEDGPGSYRFTCASRRGEMSGCVTVGTQGPPDKRSCADRVQAAKRSRLTIATAWHRTPRFPMSATQSALRRKRLHSSRGISAARPGEGQAYRRVTNFIDYPRVRAVAAGPADVHR
jgi:hypothetical protein